MRNSMPGLLQPRLEAMRKKENVQSDGRRRGEIGFTVKSDLSTFAKRTMRVLSRGKMRKTKTSLAEQTGDLEGIEHTERSPHGGNLGVEEKSLGVKKGRAKGLTGRSVKRKGLTDLSGTEKNPIVRNPGGVTRKQK
jgi:hypothetical protein